MRQAIKQRFVMLLGATALTAWALTAQAGLDDTLDEMFAGNVSGAAAFETARTNTFFGGRATFKSPVRGFNLYHISPPRMSAPSCSAIDLYGGSFSFINKQQFETLLKRIGSQSLAYAFTLALNQACPDCSDKLEELQGKLQDLNMGMKNTCTIAKTVVEKSGVKAGIRELGQIFDTEERAANTDAEDRLSAQQEVSTFSDEEGVRDVLRNPVLGNPVWKALSISDPGSGIYPYSEAGGASEDDKRNFKLMLMSIGGTTIMDPTQSCTPGEGGGNTENDHPSILSVQDLYDPDGAEQYVCQASPNRGGDPYQIDECRCLGTKELEFSGVKEFVEDNLVGDPGVEGDGSIVDTILYGTEPSEQAKRLYAHMSVPISLLRDLKNHPHELQALAGDLAEPIAKRATIDLAAGLEKAARNAFTDVDIASPPEVWQDGLDRWHEDIMRYRQDVEPGHKMIVEAAAYVEEVKRREPGYISLRPSDLNSN